MCIMCIIYTVGTILPNVVVCVVVDHAGSCQPQISKHEHHAHSTNENKTIGPRGLFYSCPAAWNNLLSALRILDQSLSVFKKNLKTFLFQN